MEADGWCYSLGGATTDMNRTEAVAHCSALGGSLGVLETTAAVTAVQTQLLHAGVIRKTQKSARSQELILGLRLHVPSSTTELQRPDLCVGKLAFSMKSEGIPTSDKRYFTCAFVISMDTNSAVHCGYPRSWVFLALRAHSLARITHSLRPTDSLANGFVADHRSSRQT